MRFERKKKCVPLGINKKICTWKTKTVLEHRLSEIVDLVCIWNAFNVLTVFRHMFVPTALFGVCLFVISTEMQSH